MIRWVQRYSAPLLTMVTILILLSLLLPSSFSLSERVKNTKAPSFQRETFDQYEVRVPAKGQSTFLYFWDESCLVCQTQLLQLNEQFEKRPEEANYQIITVYTSSSRFLFYEMQRRFALSLPTILEGEELAQMYEITQFPTAVLIDEEGKRIRNVHGMQSLEDLNFYIESLK